jgi:hypothetical protein
LQQNSSQSFLLEVLDTVPDIWYWDAPTDRTFATLKELRTFTLSNDDEFLFGDICTVVEFGHIPAAEHKLTLPADKFGDLFQGAMHLIKFWQGATK